MKHTRKNLISGIVLASSMALSLTAGAATKQSDSQLLADCIDSVNTQYENVENVKAANITSRRNFFKAKLRVSANGQRANVQCVIKDDQAVTLSCTSGTACPVSTIAAN